MCIRDRDIINVENLIQTIEAITEENFESRIYVRGDRGIAYGRVMEIISMINNAGYRRVALVTQNPS